MRLPRLLFRFFRPSVRFYFLCNAAGRQSGLIIVVTFNCVVRYAILSDLCPVEGVTINDGGGRFSIEDWLFGIRRRICPVSVEGGSVT